MDITHIPHSDISALVRRLAFKIIGLHYPTANPDELLSHRPETYTGVAGNIYPVPRGGIPVAYYLTHYLPSMVIVDDPALADIIVDDLIDSGKTKEYFAKMYPVTPFFSMIDKPNGIYKNTWISFPWETTEDKDTSADDIPVRLLQYIGEKVERGGLKETPRRYLSAWKDFTAGYGKDPKNVLKVFKDGADNVDEMVLVTGIPIYSQCEHHMVPFFGTADIAYIPNGSIVGLSKLSRVADIFARRLQVQERLTNQIADCLDKELSPLGVAVVIKCRHLCMEARGISQQGQITITSAMRGVFKDNPETRAEFMGLITK